MARALALLAALLAACAGDAPLEPAPAPAVTAPVERAEAAPAPPADLAAVEEPPEPAPPPAEVAADDPPAPSEAPPAGDTPAPSEGEPLAPSGLPLAWLACEQARDCSYVLRGDESDRCAPNVVPVARAHRAEALRRFPRRPCGHGPPGHGCGEPALSCVEGVCRARAARPRFSMEGLGL